MKKMSRSRPINPEFLYHPLSNNQREELKQTGYTKCFVVNRKKIAFMEITKKEADFLPIITKRKTNSAEITYNTKYNDDDEG